jgi:two-component system phosphate regulon response regulator PhoB
MSASTNVRVLVVEDEVDIRDLVVFNLQREGHTVMAAGDGATALALARQDPPSVVLLDVMLPDMSGMEVCARLRQEPATRDATIVMVTARVEEEDRIDGFLAGADDYVTKPFSVRELVLRVNAAARRAGKERGEQRPHQLVIGLVRIDQAAHRAFVSEEELQLTATEYRLLSWLAEHAGRLCSRGELLERVWELPASLNTRTVDTHVKRLRQKLGDAADYVETVRGAGYRFRELTER